VVETEKGTIIKKSPKYGVGKQVGNTIYLHKSVENKLPSEILFTAKNKIPNDFNYDIVKYDESNGNITFINSPDWDISDEPIVGNAILIRGDGSKRFIKQKESPQIYHHKWLFVNDSYSGFNTEESKERSRRWLKVPNIQFNKIGYKNYWDTNIVPYINENKIMKKELITEMSYTDISPEEIIRANKSSRSSGAVGPKAITPRMVLKYIKDTGNKEIKILDFGSGKDAKHTYALRDMGLDVTAHDFSSNVNDEHHDPNALNKIYDIVFASNVLNVQGSEQMMLRTIEDVLKTMNDDSVFIANFPSSPRYGFETAKEAKDILENYFDVVIIHGSDGGRTSSPVWAMTKKSKIVESFKWGDLKKQLLKEDVINCPKGYAYDDDVKNCIKIQDFEQVIIHAFTDKDIQNAYDRYMQRYGELSVLYSDNDLEVDDNLFYKKSIPPNGEYTKEFFDELYELVNTEFINNYQKLETYKREKFVEENVRTMVGKPYVWGAEGPEFFDCSGLVCMVFEEPRTTAQGLYDRSDTFTDINQVKVGDIVYFDYDPDNIYDEINNPSGDKRPIDHVGIISKKEGNKLWMIHASGNQKCTKETIEKYKDKNKCKVKEVRFSNYWKRKNPVFGSFKHFKYDVKNYA